MLNYALPNFLLYLILCWQDTNNDSVSFTVIIMRDAASGTHFVSASGHDDCIAADTRSSHLSIAFCLLTNFLLLDCLCILGNSDYVFGAVVLCGTCHQVHCLDAKIHTTIWSLFCSQVLLRLLFAIWNLSVYLYQYLQPPF